MLWCYFIVSGINSVDPRWGGATDMDGHGGHPVKERAKGIVWAAAATSPDEGSSGAFLYDGKLELW